MPMSTSAPLPPPRRCSRRSAIISRKFAAILLTGALTAVLFPRTLRADDTPADSTDTAPQSAATRPLFEELDRETQSLFQTIAPSIVRVDLPTPASALSDSQMPLSKWQKQISPEVLAQLSSLHQRLPGARFLVTEIQPATQPASATSSDHGGGVSTVSTDTPTNESTTEPSAERTSDHAGQSPSEDSAAAPQMGGSQYIILIQPRRFMPNCVGVIVDDQGHLLVPRYVPREACTSPVYVVLADGRPAEANFVGSDRMTDLTVLQLVDLRSRPARLSVRMPQPGELMLVMSVNPGLSRLSVYEGWQPDISAIVNLDGEVSGFGRNGRFLPCAPCLPIVQQLIAHGHVQRATLGVLVQMLRPDDPIRASDSLGQTPAIIVRQVLDNSAAARAGVKAGDVVIALAGQSISDLPSFAAAIANRTGPTALVVLRQGRRITLTPVLQVQ